MSEKLIQKKHDLIRRSQMDFQVASPSWTWDIFLCYRRSQKAVAARFKEKLTQYGLKVFMDIEPEAKAK